VVTALKGRRLQDVDIKTKVTTKSNAVILDASDCFVQPLERCKNCGAVKGEYLEGKENKFSSYLFTVSEETVIQIL
jgi:hypothetical protein